MTREQYIGTPEDIIRRSDAGREAWLKVQDGSSLDEAAKYAGSIMQTGNIDLSKWQRYARCKDVSDPDSFFPEPGNNNEEAFGRAKAICGGCLVRRQCRTYSLEAREEFGIWGQLSERERRRELIKIDEEAASAAEGAAAHSEQESQIAS